MNESIAVVGVEPHPRELDLHSSGLKRAGLIFGVWVLVWLAFSAAFFSEGVKRDPTVTFSSVALPFVPYFIPWVPFSLVLSRVLAANAERLTELPKILGLFLGATFLFFLPYLAYEIWLGLSARGLALDQFFVLMKRVPIRNLLMDSMIFLACFAIHYGVALIQKNWETERRHRRVEAANLALQLALERQRLVALQAQLEPHFLFNALNAISNLVQGEDQALTLEALSRLSELLRYALRASQEEWVTVEEELSFVRDYMAMQRLRFGDRLRFLIEGDTPQVCAADCPPLLLQPLLENALRHDLECHEGTSTLTLAFHVEGESLYIRVRNSVHPGVAPNPGLGQGLPTVRTRIETLYGDRGTFEAGLTNHEFEVALSIPRVAHD